MGFKDIANFSSVVTARASGWEKVGEEIIERTGKSAYYLFQELEILMSMLAHEIMSVRDRENMKRLVALVRAKRAFKKEAPGARAVAKMLQALEADSQFPEAVEGVEPNGTVQIRKG